MCEVNQEKIRKKAVAAFECRYYYEDLGPFRVFFNAKEVLLDALINETDHVSYQNIDRFAAGNGQLQSALKKIIKNRFGGIEKIDGFVTDDPILPEELQAWVKNIRVTRTNTGLDVCLGVEGVFDLYKTFGKDGQDHIKNISVSKDTVFVCRDQMVGYQETYFSLALKSESLSIAIYSMPNNLPIKGTALLGVSVWKDNVLYMENASKYMDITPFVSGLRS